MTTQMGAQTRQDDQAPQQMQSQAPARPRTEDRIDGAPRGTHSQGPQPQMGGVVFNDWAAI